MPNIQRALTFTRKEAKRLRKSIIECVLQYVISHEDVPDHVRKNVDQQRILLYSLGKNGGLRRGKPKTPIMSP